MKCRAVRDSVDQKRQHISNLYKTRRPAMQHEKWDSLRNLASLVHKMNVILTKVFNVDVRSVLRELVEFRFNSPPVEIMLPVESQSLDFRQGSTTRPWVDRVGDFRGQVC